MGMYGRGYQVQWGTSGAWLWGCWGVASRCNVDLGGVATGYRVVAARCGGAKGPWLWGCRGLPKGRVYGYCAENCRGVSSGTFRGVVTGLGWVPQEYDYGCRGEPQEQRYRVQEGNCRCGNTVQR